MVFIRWLDQPAGVGFSYQFGGAKHEGTESAVSKDVHTFLIAWFEAHPEYRSNPFFVVGESYAGHYVPSIAHYIQKQNKLQIQSKINLRGVAIGNGDTGVK